MLGQSSILITSEGIFSSPFGRSLELSFPIRIGGSIVETSG